MKVSVVLPCLNESVTIARAVAEAFTGLKNGNLQGEVIVADNGSTDDSRELAQQAGAKIINVPDRGYGAALRSGIDQASGDIIIFADSDLSYPLADLNLLVSPIINQNIDFVLGNRLQGKIADQAMPFLNRYLGTPVLSWLLSKAHHLSVSDCNSGMRAFKKNVWSKIRPTSSGMEFASEMLIRVATSKISYQEVPINFFLDQRGKAPHLQRWQDGPRHLRLILASAPSERVINYSFIIGLSFLMISWGLSFEQFFFPEIAPHYHTAFALIGLAMATIMLGVLLLVVRARLEERGLVRSRLLELIRKIAGQLPFVYLAMIAGLLFLLEGVLLVASWISADFYNLFEIGRVIRMVIYSDLMVIALSLDFGITKSNY